MERKEVYAAIDSERAYQQAEGYPDNAATPTRWLDAISYYTDKAWSNTHEAEVMANIRKIAALCVAALEQYGCEPREGYDYTARELLRKGLIKGRVRTKGVQNPSELLPSFEKALASAGKDDLLWALEYLIRTKAKRQSFRELRIRRIDETLRSL